MMKTAAFSRRRLAGYNVVDRPRPRTSIANLNSTNHGGVAVIAEPGVNVSPVSTINDVSTSALASPLVSSKPL